MAKELIKVGARKIDVTGLSPAMRQKVVMAAKSGGSLASRALAQQFQKQAQGPTTKNVSTPDPTINNPGGMTNLPGTTQANTGNPSVQNAGPQNTAQSNDYYGANQAYDPSGYKPGVAPTSDVKAGVPDSIAGSGQYKSADTTLDKGKTGVNADGTINPDRATQSIYNTENQDFSRNFNANNPGTQVDSFGNRQDIITDPSSGQTKVVQSAGGPLAGTLKAFQGALGSYTSDFGDAVSKAQNANYNYQTRNLQSDKAQEMEARKQELAQRGIPIDYSEDPNKPSLWQKTLGDIDRKYQGLTDQANNQAIMQGNETLGAQVGAQNSILGSLTNTAQAFKQAATPYQGANVDSSGAILSGIQTSSAANANKYAVDKQAATSAAQIAAQQKIAAANAAAQKEANKPSGPVFHG